MGHATLPRPMATVHHGATRGPRMDRAARRRQLLDAARGVLEAEGYADMGMREVAAAAGVSPGTLYTYFPSREGLFAVLYAERLDVFNAQIGPAAASETDLRTLLRTIADAYTPMYRMYARELSPWTARSGGGLHPDVAAVLVPSATAALSTVTVAVDRLTEGSLSSIEHSAMWAMLTGIADRVTGVRARLVPVDWDDLADTAVEVLATGLEAAAAR